MFEIPKYKVLKAYNSIDDACLDCQDKDCATCLVQKAKDNLLNFSKHDQRLDEAFLKEGFADYNYENFDKLSADAIEDIYNTVHECCEKCGVYHTEKCFINNTRESLQLLLYGEVKEFDGIEFKE